MARDITMRNTKAEILEAYDEMKKELSGLRQEVQRYRPPAAGEQLEAQQAPQVQQEVDVDRVLTMLKGFKVNLSDMTSTLQRRLTTNARELQDLLAEAGTEAEQLEQLHDITPEEGTLDELIEQHIELSERFETQLDLEREAFEQQMSGRREAWADERERHQRRVDERDAEWNKRLARDEEEYTYERDQERQRDQEAYEQRRDQLEQALHDYEERRREELAAREDEITGREQAYEALKVKVADFETELEEAVKAARGQGYGIAKKRAKVKADLAAKEHEGKKRVYELRIERLQETADKQAETLRELGQQLLETKRQAQSLAAKALESSANSTSFEAVREIAIEQAKHAQKGK